MLAKIINDFNSVKMALECIVGRKIPVWVALLYYIILLPLGLALAPFLIAWRKIYVWNIVRKIKKITEAE